MRVSKDHNGLLNYADDVSYCIFLSATESKIEMSNCMLIVTKQVDREGIERGDDDNDLK